MNVPRNCHETVTKVCKLPRTSACKDLTYRCTACIIVYELLDMRLFSPSREGMGTPQECAAARSQIIWIMNDHTKDPAAEKSGAKYKCYLFFKRMFDILSSGIMLLLFSWLILLCLLIKWLEDFHNPIYVSKRVGKDGKIFRFYKIRTMCPNAEEMKQKLIEAGLNEADPPAFKMKNDPRITKVGKVFRKLSLDELPQLFNIFNGTMSVVGPRPPIPSEVEQYTPYQRHRLDVKGGLLCLWQIQKNRNALSFDEWVRLDLEYIERQSFWLDMKIIFKGAYMVVFDRSGE